MLSFKRCRRSMNRSVNRSFKAFAATVGVAALLGAPVNRACAEDQSWIKSSVIYCVFPSIFSPSGDLAGVTHELKRLKDTGVTVVWLMPITPVGHAVNGHPSFGSPYCVQNYEAINPEYGTAKDLHNLVDTAHRLHMKVILDAVLNHSAWDNALITDHPDYYAHSDTNIHDPNTIRHAFSYNDVAQFDYSSPGLRDYMIGMLSRWLKTYDLDGFRFDAADNPSGPNRLIPADFWQELGRRLHKVKPNILLLGESGVPELADKPFDVQYGWILYDGVKNAIQESNAAKVHDAWNYQVSQTPSYIAMQDNWDKLRDIHTFGGPEGALAVAVFNQTGNGVPLIYNGMEIGNAEGKVNPHGKIDWSKANPVFTALYKQLGALRGHNAALREGRMAWVPNNMPSQVLTYTKTAKDTEFLVEINLSKDVAKGTVSIPAGAAWTDVTPRGPWPAPVRTESGGFVLQPKGFAIYRRTRD